MHQDDNFIYFITERLTKSNIYPPLELAQSLNREQIVASWQNLVKNFRNKDYQGHTFGLYLHFPFCPSKCSFCYCPSYAETDFNKIKKYTNSMLREIEFFGGLFSGFEVKTIYVGGGTPSYLPIEDIKIIFKEIFSKFKMQKKDWQFNFEASPQTLTTEKLELLKDLGVNRLSMGVQSIFGKVLSQIQRNQNYEIIQKAVESSRKIGIPYINLDYVAGLPGETLASFTKGFSQIMKLRPDIIHLYPFSPTQDTRFIKEGNSYQKKNILLRGRMLKIGEKIIKNAGYKEIKNESWGLSFKARNTQDAEKKEVPCSVLGLGKYARSNISKILHYRNSPIHYDHADGYEYEGCYLNTEEEMRHFLMGSLRGGFYLSDFYNIFKVDALEKFKNQFEYLKSLDKLKVEDDLVRMMTVNTNEYHFLCKKIFYSNEVMMKLREYFTGIYEPDLDYKTIFTRTFDANF